MAKRGRPAAKRTGPTARIYSAPNWLADLRETLKVPIMPPNDLPSETNAKGKKPIHLMSPVERLAESLDRVVALYRYFSGQGVKAKLEDRTLTLETDVNNYFIDVSEEEPRFVTMQAVYVVESGDYARAALTCALATERSYGAKALARPHGTGYRLHFLVQLVVLELSAFTAAVGLYQAMIEDCREAYLKTATDAPR